MKLHTHREGHGTPFVFLHGLFGSWENWGSQMRRFTDRYQVIGIDLRNHGRSGHSDVMNYAVMADDVEETLSDLDISSCILLGHSMGGKVAMQLATQRTAQSAAHLATQAAVSIDRLIIVDIAPRHYRPHHGTILQAINALSLSAISSRRDADEQLKPLIQEDAIRLFLLKNLVRAANHSATAFTWRMNLAALTSQYHRLLEAPTQKTRVISPTLLIKGAESDYIDANDHALPDHWFQNWQLDSVDGAGHWPHASHPDRVFELLSHFLDDTA